MSTKREAIMVAVMAALAGTVGVGSRIYRSREDVLTREESPALLVAWESEEPGAVVSGLTEKLLNIVVAVYVRGDTPDALADPTVESVHSKLMVSPTLGGLAIDISETGTSLDTEDADQTAAIVSMRFAVWYRHSRANLAS